MEQLKELLKKLEAERQPLMDELNALRAERDAGIQSGEITVARESALAAMIKELSPRIAPLDNQIAALHRAMGAKGLGSV